MKVVFLVGSLGISGGTNMILHYMLGLQESGMEVDIVTLYDKDLPQAWHKGFDSLNWIKLEEVTGAYDLCIATFWATVYEMPKIQARQYMYFVQSIESIFDFNIGDNFSAQMTYAFGLPFVSVAPWITNYLIEHGSQGYTVLNGLDKNIFNQDVIPFEERKGFRVLIEGQLNRFIKNVDTTIKYAKKSKAKDNIWLVTLSNKGSIAGMRVFSALSQADMARVYSSCDVLVKLSYVESVGMPPLEMFHCGGTVIMNKVPGHELYMEHGVNGFVVDSEKDVVAYLNLLKDDPHTLLKMQQEALKTAASWPSIEQSQQDFVARVRDIMNLPPFDIQVLERMVWGVRSGLKVMHAYNTRCLELSVFRWGMVIPRIAKWLKMRWLRVLRRAVDLPDPFGGEALTYWERFSLMSMRSSIEGLLYKIKGLRRGK